MELSANLIDIFINLDEYLGVIFQKYGSWTYLILFLIIFCETGLVITPFLPGDSLLFVVGALAASGSLHVGWLFVLLTVAGILGDTVNYHIGYYVGPKVFHKNNIRFLNKEHLTRTHLFYEKHGGKTIIIARFIPIIRTFAPFVAGIGRMSYRRFIAYNIIGSIIWVGTFLLAGYYFGNLPVVKDNFSFVILVIIIISILPVIINYIKARSSPAARKRYNNEEHKI